MPVEASTELHVRRWSNEDGIDVGEVYSGRDNIVRLSPFRITYKDCCRLVTERFPTQSRRVTIRFLTPTLLKADGKLVERPEFHHVIKRLRDRINALAHFYCDDTLDLDFKAFGTRAEAVRMVRSASNGKTATGAHERRASPTTWAASWAR